MKRRLIVHIGNPKAGSSSIQKFLYENRQDFEIDGIFYPAPPGTKEESHSALAKHYLNAALAPGQEALPIELLEKMIAETSAPTIVLSSEYFIHAHNHPQMMRALAQLVRSCDLDPTVIALVRPQIFWLNSAYTQNVKYLLETTLFNHFVNKQLRRNLHYFSATYDVWRKFGNFVAVPFSSAHLRPRLEIAFMKAAGFPEDLAAKYGQRQTAVTNASPGPLTIAAYRMAGARLRSLGDAAAPRNVTVRRKIQKMAESYGWDNTPFNGLTNEIVDRVNSHFERFNDHFARSVWGKRWLDIFPEIVGRQFVSNEVNRNNCSADELKTLRHLVAFATRPAMVAAKRSQIE
jgi:hypothetical protein